MLLYPYILEKESLYVLYVLDVIGFNKTIDQHAFERDAIDIIPLLFKGRPKICGLYQKILSQ